MKTSTILRSSGLIALSLALFSCATVQSMLTPAHGKPLHGKSATAKNAAKKPPQLHYNAAGFVEHLTLARLALENTEDISPAAADLDALQSYSAQAQKPTNQLIVVLDYQAKDSNSLRQIVAPLVGPSFPALLEIMDRLKDKPYTLHDIHIASASVAPEPLKLTDSDINDVRLQLEQQQLQLMSSSEKLPALDDAHQQLQLIRFFTQHRCRDAAYLSVDNVKRLLASANNPNDAELVKNLSKQLENLEGQLHKTLPFTLP